jgi:hypothetical protein
LIEAVYCVRLMVHHGQVFQALGIHTATALEEGLRAVARSGCQVGQQGVSEDWPLAAGIDGLDTFHPGQAAIVLTPALRAKILSAFRKKPRNGSTYWSCCKLAAARGINKDAMHCA